MRQGANFHRLDTEKAQKIRRKIGIEDTSRRMAELFKVMSEPTRLKIIQSLEVEELCVSDLAGLLDLPQPSISHHLNQLKHFGLVRPRKEGKLTLYSLRESRISAIISVAKDFAGD